MKVVAKNRWGTVTMEVDGYGGSGAGWRLEVVVGNRLPYSVFGFGGK